MSNEFDTPENQETALTIFQPSTFLDIAIKPVTDEQADILLGEIDPDDLDILPTGEVYLTQARYRQKLNKAFRPGGWAMRPLSKPYVKDDLAMQEWALYANGQFMAYTVGGAEYKENNNRMNWSDVLETAKSNALMRLCKDLGIASECWNKRFTEQFKSEYCVKVWVEGKNKPQWRRLDSASFYQETGPATDSPNQSGQRQQQPPKQKSSPVVVEPKRESAPGKITRPMTPEDVKKATIAKTKYTFANPPAEKQATYAFSSLSKACEGDEDARHAVVAYLFNVASMKDLTGGQCSFLIDWIGATADNSYVANPDAVKEIEMIVIQRQRDLGQVDMFESEVK